MNKLQRRLRYYKLRFLRLKGDPKSIARGVALGTFIGITPTLPLHIATPIIAPLIRQSHGAFLAGLRSALTYFPQYYLSGSSVRLTPDLTWERTAVLEMSPGAGYQVTFSAFPTSASMPSSSCAWGPSHPVRRGAYIVTFRFFQTP
jgi:hypothetical protein